MMSLVRGPLNRFSQDVTLRTEDLKKVISVQKNSIRFFPAQNTSKGYFPYRRPQEGLSDTGDFEKVFFIEKTSRRYFPLRRSRERLLRVVHVKILSVQKSSRWSSLYRRPGNGILRT